VEAFRKILPSLCCQRDGSRRFYGLQLSKCHAASGAAVFSLLLVLPPRSKAMAGPHASSPRCVFFLRDHPFFLQPCPVQTRWAAAVRRHAGTDFCFKSNPSSPFCPPSSFRPSLHAFQESVFFPLVLVGTCRVSRIPLQPRTSWTGG